MFGPEVGIGLGTNLTPDECLVQSGRLAKTRRQICDRAQDKSAQWRNAVALGNKEVSRVLWADLEALWTDYRIVSAWSELFYAIHVFMTDGTESDFMEIGSQIVSDKSI